MTKRVKFILPKIVLVAFIVFILNIGFFIYGLNSNITGETIVEAGLGMPVNSWLIIGGLWFFLIMFMIFGAISDKRLKISLEEADTIDIKELTDSSGTDFDKLYRIVQERKQIRVSTIAQIFNIKESLAMEWAKIMESSNLVDITYKFREAIVKLKGFEEEIKEKKEKERRIRVIKQKVKALVLKDKSLRIFKKISLSFKRPSELFSRTKDEKIWSSFKYLLTIMLFPCITILILLALGSFIFTEQTIFYSDLYTSALFNSLSISDNPVINIQDALTLNPGTIILLILTWLVLSIIIYLFAIILSLLLSLIVHIFIKLFRGKGKYRETYKAAIYSSSPIYILFILSIIPGINLITFVWSLVLFVKSLAFYHSIKKNRAFLAIILSCIIIGLILTAILYSSYGNIYQNINLNSFEDILNLIEI